MRRLILVAAILCGPSLAGAQDASILVLPFQGPRAGAARTAVVRGLDQYELVSQREAVRTASRLRVDIGSPSGMLAVAQALDVTLTVWGTVQGRGTEAVVVLHVLNQAGNELASETAPLPIDRQHRDQLAAVAAAAVAQALEQETRRLAREPVESTSPPADEGVELAAPPIDETRVHEEQVPEDDVDDRPPVLVATVGFGLRGRDAEIEVAGGGLRVYEARSIGQLTFGLELRPLAFVHSAANGLYLAVDGEVAVGLESTEQATGMRVGTTAYRVLAALGYLYDFNRPGSFVGGTVGFEIDRFDLVANSVMPSSTYNQLRVGALGRFAIINTVLHAQLDAGFRYLFGVGDMSPAFGTEADGIGFDFKVAVGGALDVGFVWELRLIGLRLYKLSFGGTFTDVAAGDGTDRALLLPAAQVGWRF